MKHTCLHTLLLLGLLALLLACSSNSPSGANQLQGTFRSNYHGAVFPLTLQLLPGDTLLVGLGKLETPPAGLRWYGDRYKLARAANPAR